MITLLIADDHPLYRDALKGALSLSLPALTLKEAGDLTTTVDILKQEDIDLLLLDLHMPGSNDLFGLLHIRKLFPHVPVAVVSGTEDSTIISKIISYTERQQKIKRDTIGFLEAICCRYHLPISCPLLFKNFSKMLKNV